MANAPLALYYDMSEKLSDHVRSTRAYPLKFVLSPLQHEDYLRDVALLSHSLGKEMNASNHMGVSIEISADSPGAMIAIDGTAIWLL